MASPLPDADRLEFNAGEKKSSNTRGKAARR
jgi:hypothetical protein